MRRRIIPKLSRQIRRQLQRLSRKTRHAEYRTRIQIVLLYDHGFGTTKVARMLNTVPSRARDVLVRYRESGEAGLIDRRQENGQPKIDDDLLQALWEILEQSPPDFGWRRPRWTRELIRRQILAQTGVDLSLRTVGRMLGMIGAALRRPKPVVFGPWSKGRKRRRLEAIRAVIENLPEGEVGYYEDEVDIHLNPRIGPDWTLPGHRRYVVTPGRNEKRYVAGALSLDASDLIWVAADRKTSTLFMALVNEIRRRNPTARHIHLVLDNYIIHTSRMAARHVAKYGDVFRLHFLPPYSPDDNKIERFWKDLHDNVTRNHRCETMDALMVEVNWFLRTERRRRQRRARTGAPNQRRLSKAS